MITTIKQFAVFYTCAYLIGPLDKPMKKPEQNNTNLRKIIKEERQRIEEEVEKEKLYKHFKQIKSKL